jgi:DNA-binding response OmpR family regulator
MKTCPPREFPTLPDSLPFPAESSFPRPRILVVDDDYYVRELNAGVLIRSGYQVDTAVDGVDAWRALHDDHYDLLITDEQMPWVTGLELIQKLRAEAMLLPVILASGLPPQEELNRRSGLRIQAVITKPCPLTLLLQTVKSVLCAAAGTGAAPDPHTQMALGQMD